MFLRRVLGTASRPLTRRTMPVVSRRFMGSGHGPFVPHEPTEAWQKHGGTLVGAVMWFWIFYRVYHDGKPVFFGIGHPWDHDEEGGHH